jgi:hypothetical protein
MFMKKKSLFPVFLIAFMSWLVVNPLSGSTEGEGNQERPNIVIFIADDLG